MEKENKPVFGLVKCGKLAIRSKPSKTADILDVAVEGSLLRVNMDKTTQNFYSVQYDGIEGFCSKQFIQI